MSLEIFFFFLSFYGKYPFVKRIKLTKIKDHKIDDPILKWETKKDEIQIKCDTCVRVYTKRDHS